MRQGDQEREAQADKAYHDVEFTDPQDKEMQVVVNETAAKFDTLTADFFLAAWSMGDLGVQIVETTKSVQAAGLVMQGIYPCANVMVMAFGRTKGWTDEQTVEYFNDYTSRMDAIVAKYTPAQEETPAITLEKVES